MQYTIALLCKGKLVSEHAEGEENTDLEQPEDQLDSFAYERGKNGRMVGRGERLGVFERKILGYSFACMEV